MELKVKELDVSKGIEFNFDELKEEIIGKAALYKNMVYTDDTIKEAKADKAALNKFIAALEDKRKEVKKQCMQPYEAFERQIKELVSIINEPVQLIDAQVKEYEERQKAEKRQKLEAHFETIDKPEWVTLEAIFDTRWLNTTFSLKKAKEAMEEWIGQIDADLETLQSLPEFAFEATEEYKRSLDLNRAVAEGQRLSDIQKRKAEAEAARKAKEERERQETQTQDLPLPQTSQEDVSEPESEPADKKQWVRFAALLTVPQAHELKAFFDSRNIEFKSV